MPFSSKKRPMMPRICAGETVAAQLSSGSSAPGGGGGTPRVNRCPLERWLSVLAEADQSVRNQTRFITSMDEPEQRKAYDLIEARRLAWSLTALYGPDRRTKPARACAPCGDCYLRAAAPVPRSPSAWFGRLAREGV
jgi:hypothetical protein